MIIYNYVIIITMNSNNEIKQIISRMNIIDNSILYPYQKKHAKLITYSLLTYGRALDTSDTGTGKTYCSLYTAKQLNLRPFVIAPKNALYNWRRSIKKIELESYGVVNYELLKLGKYPVFIPDKNKYVNRICPYVNVTKIPEERREKYDPKEHIEWYIKPDMLIIFDECHRCKNHKTGNFNLLTSIPKDAFVIMLSATIGENSLKLMGVAKVLKLYDNNWEMYDWCSLYGAKKVNINRDRKVWVDRSIPSDILRLHNDIGLRMHGIRTELLVKKNLFPETKIIAEPITLNEDETDEINNQYESIYKKLDVLEYARQKFIVKEQHLQILQKELQRIELQKVSTIVDMTMDFIEEGFSVVIFVNYTDTLLELLGELNTHCCIYGENDSKLNEANRLMFEDNKSRIIVCNIASAQESIDLHDKYHKFKRISLISPNFSAQTLKQVLGRIHRAGSTNSVQYILFASGTPEENIAKVVKKRISNIDILNDGEIPDDLF